MDDYKSRLSKKHSIKAADDETSGSCAATPFELLCREDQQINPAILLAEELILKRHENRFDFDDYERADEILRLSKIEIEKVQMQFDSISKTPGEPSKIIPSGF